jgi:hypothetical protein
MVVISSLQAALDGLRRNPILFAIAAAYGVLQLPQLVAQGVHPLFASIVSIGMIPIMVFVVPFFLAGMVAMANEAIDGTTSLETFVSAGKHHYVSVFVAYLLLMGINLVLGMGFVLALVFGGWMLLLGGGEVGLAVAAILAITVLVLLCLYLGVAFVLQFFAHTIVIDGHGAIDGLQRSVSIVRTNLRDVFGYSLLVGAVGLVVGIFAGVLSMIATFSARLRSTPDSGVAIAPGVPADLLQTDVVGMVVAGLLYVFVTALFGGAFAAYSTSFYRAIRSDDGNGPTEEST